MIKPFWEFAWVLSLNAVKSQNSFCILDWKAQDFIPWPIMFYFGAIGFDVYAGNY
jgi:hypothetical protein